MPQLTPQQLKLIEHIKKGTPLHYDIDDVGFLNEILQEIKQTGWIAQGRHTFYYLDDGVWDATDGNKPNAIKLSSFKPKVVEVDKLLELLDKQDPCDLVQTVLNNIRTYLNQL